MALGGHAQGDRPLPRLAVARGRDAALLSLRPRAVRGLARDAEARPRRRRRAGARRLRDRPRPRTAAPRSGDDRAQGIGGGPLAPRRAPAGAGSRRAPPPTPPPAPAGRA